MPAAQSITEGTSSDFEAFNAAYGAAFGEHRPARTTTCPGLLGEILVEIDCVALVE